MKSKLRKDIIETVFKLKKTEKINNDYADKLRIDFSLDLLDIKEMIIKSTGKKDREKI